MSSTIEEPTLTAPGISCGHCVATIMEAVGALGGVERVEVSEATKQVSVAFDPHRVSLTDIRRALDEAGYPAKP
jgi:copper ion binding protein